MTDVGVLQKELDRRTRELHEAEGRFRNLIARNADAIVVVDDNGQVRFGNPAAATLFRRSADALVGAPFGFPLVVGETSELDIVGPAGDAVVAEMRVMETEWEGEHAYLAVLRDITERKRAETERAELLREQVARAEAEQALRDRDAFLAVASHELRTPLSTLSLAAQVLRRRLLRDGAIEPADLDDSLAKVDVQARRIALLVEHLLDVSRINVGYLDIEKRSVDLRPLIDEVVAQCQATTTRHTIIVRAPDRLAASVDPTRFEQVVTNLLDNAIKFSPEGGPIEVDLAGGTPETPTVRLAVRDHGLGISAERRSQLFERFYQAHVDDHVSGLGLGLFISRHIVELHGGQLSAELPEDGGARFVVTLHLGSQKST